MRSLLATWRVSLARTRADWPIVAAAWLITMLAAILFSAGLIYPSAATEAGLRRALADAPPGATDVDASFYEPVQSSIPALILSGDIDPITPPVWGEEVAKTLPNSRHIVVPGTGHTAGGTGCGRRLIKAFIDAGTAQSLDTGCVDKMTRPPYFITPAGPSPK